MANLASTQTGLDIAAATRKRMETNGLLMSDSQIHTLMVDIMVVINTDAASVVAHALTEITAHP